MSNNTDTLQALAAALNISLTFNDDHVCDLLLDGDALVTLEGDPQGTTLQLNGVIGPLPDPQSPQGLRLLLQANFNGQGTGSCNLGLDHVSDEVVLGRQVDVTTLGEAGLEPVVGEFANYLLYWRANLQRLIAEESTPAANRETFGTSLPGMLA
jgi:hypothetical protein